MMSRKPRLHVLTVGYEAVTLPDFVETLSAARVTRLLDVRELPISRRKGFSKTALSTALAAVGIAYQHERALGSPRHIRHRLRDDGNFTRYFADFREYLATQRSLLDDLAAGLDGSVALLCYERNPTECHRSVVAAALAKRAKTTVEHLTVPLHDARQASPTARPHPRQGVPSAE
jgi:uncharacterized protein (DUF488 family)